MDFEVLSIRRGHDHRVGNLTEMLCWAGGVTKKWKALTPHSDSRDSAHS